MLKLSRLVENSSIELFCDFEMQAGTIQAFRCLFLEEEFLTDEIFIFPTSKIHSKFLTYNSLD